MKNLLGFGRGYDVKWYFDDNEFERLGKTVLNKTLSDVKSGRNHIQLMMACAAEAINRINHFDKLNFRHQNSEELKRNLNKYLKALDASIPIIYAPLVIDLDLFEYTKKILAKFYNSSEEKLEIIITPIKPTPVLQLEIDLLNILTKKTPARLLKKKLEFLRKKYYWLGMRFVDNEPLSINYFEKQLHDLKKINYRCRLSNYQDDSGEKRKNFNKAILPFSTKERRFLKLVNEYSFLRHFRDVYRGAAHYYGRFIYQEIQRRFKISIQDLLTYTIDELKWLINKNNKLNKEEVIRRKKHFLYLLIGKKRTVISQPQTIKKILGYQLPRQDEEKKPKKEITGQIAYQGKTKGRVRIIHLNTLYRDLKNFKHGEVMVTEGTKPDYIAAMKKAAAIITNEGGITCHAAIISREFKIPCIVGTKIATKALKDGDLVEVDASKEIVKILKK